MNGNGKSILLKYNTIFSQNGLKIRIIKWKGGIFLNNNIVIKSKDENRKFRVRFESKYLLPFFDTIYGEDCNNKRDDIVKEIHRENNKKITKNFWINLDEDTKKKRINHMIKIQKLGITPEVLARRKYVEPWNKGKTKETDERLLKLSEDRKGEGNPSFGKKCSEESKRKQSITLKEKIKNGEFTPNVHNSRTHWDSIFNGKKYRSSWEAIYHSINEDDLFEDIRLEYKFDNDIKIYIVDFVNHSDKILTEIKPDAHKNEPKFKAKIKAAEEWCKKNNYTFRILTEKYFIENFEKIQFDKLEIPNLKSKLREIYEASKKN